MRRTRALLLGGLLCLGLGVGSVQVWRAFASGREKSPVGKDSARRSLIRLRWDAIPVQGGDDYTAGEEIVDSSGQARLTTWTWGIEVVRTWSQAGGWQRRAGRMEELGVGARIACQRVFEERALQLGFGEVASSAPEPGVAETVQFPTAHSYRVMRDGPCGMIRSFSFLRDEEEGHRVEVRADLSDYRPFEEDALPWVSMYSRDGHATVEVRLTSAESISLVPDPFDSPPPVRFIEGDDVCSCCYGRPLESTRLGEVPVDSLRDPETQVASLFPQADRYATRLLSFLRKGGEAAWKSAAADMGGPWDKDTEGVRTVYPFYPAFAGGKIIGYAFCSSSPGAHGKIQLAVALDPEGRPIAAEVQTINSDEASRLMAPGFLQGLLRKLTESGHGPSASETRDEAAMTRCLIKAQVLFGQFLGH